VISVELELRLSLLRRATSWKAVDDETRLAGGERGKPPSRFGTGNHGVLGFGQVADPRAAAPPPNADLLSAPVRLVGFVSCKAFNGPVPLAMRTA